MCLSRHLEYLIRETYDWFSKSSSRQNTYKNLYKAINNKEEPLKIISACKTRWLSIETAVSRIADQWLELKTHFNISRNVEKCYTAETLYCMYSDDKIYAFLSFLITLLQEVQRVNKLFESASADPTKLIKELNQLITIFIIIIIQPVYVSTAGRRLPVVIPNTRGLEPLVSSFPEYALYRRSIVTVDDLYCGRHLL